MMKTTEEVNELAIEAGEDLREGNGRTETVWNLIAEFLPKINDLELEHGTNFNDSGAFLDRCEKKIEYAAKTFNPNIQNFEALANRTLQQVVKDFYKRKSGYKKGNHSFEYITDRSTEDTPKTTIQIEDESSDVETSVISDEFTEEIIDEYGGNEKHYYIINRWIEEGKALNEHDLAREMADIFGGKWDSHRQTVKRLRNKLKNELSTSTT